MLLTLYAGYTIDNYVGIYALPLIENQMLEFYLEWMPDANTLINKCRRDSKNQK